MVGRALASLRAGVGYVLRIAIRKLLLEEVGSFLQPLLEGVDNFLRAAARKVWQFSKAFSRRSWKLFQNFYYEKLNAP